MSIGNLTRMASRAFNSVTRVSVWIGYIALIGIVLVTFVDASGRYLFRSPFLGSYEVVLLAMTILSGFAITYTAVRRGHVAIDLIVGRLPRRAQIVIQGTYSLLSAIIWVALAYRVYLYAVKSLEASERSDTLHLPVAPFLFTLAVAMFLCCLPLLVQTFRPQVSETKSGEKEV